MAFGIVNTQSSAVSETAAIELDTVSGATATAGAKQVTLTWSDPGNAVVNNAVLAKWGGTVVVRKVGSAPTSRTDGTVIVNSTVRNAYSENGFVDTDVENGKLYYYAFYPYTTAGGYSEAVAVSATPYFIEVTVPTFSGDSTFVYNTNSRTPAINNPDSTYINTSDDSTLTATNVGNYSIKYDLKDTDKQKWKDGTFTTKTLNWSITQANGAVSLSSYTLALDISTTTGTVTINQTGDGELSVETAGDSVVSCTISGKTLTVTRLSGNPAGTCSATVKAAATTNYKAASATALVITCTNYKTMTVTINMGESDPAKACTYADDATSMTAGSAAWDTFFGHYPCLFAAGVEGVKLNPNNYDKDINGNSVTINSGSNDVMVCFPRRGLKMSKSGNVITISMTDNPNDSNFEYMAHKRGSTLKDKFYIGAYMGSEISSKLRSLKGQSIAVSKTHEAFRNLAQANGKPNGSGGSGYDQHGWYQLIYLQCMFVLKYKTLNAQTAIGRGFVDGNSAQKATGGTEAKGMDWGETTGKDHMKLFGIEDLYGNVWSWIDGFWMNASRQIQTATENFNSSGSGYTTRGSTGLSSDTSGYIDKAMGTTHDGFIGISKNGSETTYFCDYFDSYASRLLQFGGRWSGGSVAGMFYLYVLNGASASDASIGSRLMWL